ncbi:Zn-dependent exopeptidase [Ramicandelaber brevisporus]|nr:Zn-dependent exopeptidase [Ramicandelaber brevisporus]
MRFAILPVAVLAAVSAVSAAAVNTDTTSLADGIRLLSRDYPDASSDQSVSKRVTAFSTLQKDAANSAEAAELAKQLQKGRTAVDAALAQRYGFRLVQTSENAIHSTWMTEDEKLLLRQLRIKFIDVTDEAVAAAKGEIKINALAAPKASPLPTAPSQGEKVRAVTATLNTTLMKSALKTLSNFQNRYYNSDYGRQSSASLNSQVLSIIQSTGRSDVTASTYKHSFPQTSTIATIPGSTKASEIVIISAHQDSINQWSPRTGRAPGADDDGTGTVTILEAFRGLLASGFKPARTVEFHWYAGEEGGLLGSKDISNSYKRSSRAVHAQAQFDMTGYPETLNQVGIINDYTNPELTEFVRKLFRTYTSAQPVDLRCGYGCSDHASWYNAGYRSSAPFETASLDYNGYIHTESDSYEKVNFDHALHFAKVAAAFAIELAA